MKIFSRAQRVYFSHIFYDSSGDLADASTANLYVTYPTSEYAGATTNSTVALTENTTTFAWSGYWDSSVSQPGTVFWHVRAIGADDSIATDDGEFVLRANLANLSRTSSI